MIKIEITDSPLSEQLGSVIFHKNSIYIGKTYGDILIDDKKMLNNYLFIEILEEQNVLFCHPHPSVSHFHVNKKRCETPRKITINDTITILNVTVKIIEFKYIPIVTFKAHLNKCLDQLIESHSPIIDIVKQLETSEK
jgi:hypothetical protein